MKKMFQRAVILIAMVALILGMIPKDTLAGGDYEYVPVKGDVIDLTNVDHKHASLSNPNLYTKDVEIRECPDQAYSVTVPANTSDYEWNIPVSFDEVYNINVLNAAELKYSITNGSGSSYEGTDKNKKFTYSITKKSGISLKITNSNSTDKKVSILVDPCNQVFAKTNVTRLTVGKDTRFYYSCSNLPQGEYAFKIQFYTDSTFTKIDNNRSLKSAEITTKKNANGYYSISGRDDNIEGSFKTTSKAYMTFSVIKVTDVSDYSTVENNDLFIYKYTVKESGLYMVYRAYEVGTPSYHFTRGYKKCEKGEILEVSSLSKQSLSYISFKKLSDISSVSGVKDRFSVIDNTYLFSPEKSDDYYFSSSTPLNFMVTDLASGEIVSGDNLLGAALKAGRSYAVSVSIIKGSRENYEFKICKKVEKETSSASNETSFGGFVERLYNVALGRPSDKDGKAFWCENVSNGNRTGAACAREFLLSEEFKSKNVDDSEFLKILYKVFFDRDAANDPEGYNYWLGRLKTDGRDVIINGFIDSQEWCDICATYGVRSGSEYAKSSKASDNSIAFATRLYTECLGRAPEEDGLKFWSMSLTNQERTGTQAAREFFYSPEFINKNLNDDEYVTRLYKTFMGREPEAEGKAYWLDRLSNGASRDEVFDSFAVSQEFTDICAKYAISR